MPILQRIKAAVLNPYLWGGLVLLAVFSGVLYVSFNSWIMPAVTRHGVSIEVPDVLEDSIHVAMERLTDAGLVPETQMLRKSNLPRDVVIDQNPPPNSDVKPGRRVYLTINSGDTTTVLVPRVLGLTVRQASNEMSNINLVVAEALPDSIPHPHAGSVTLQRPESGERVPPGTEVQLWYSQGLGSERVSVPDVTGMEIEEAQERLLELKLRSIVLGGQETGEESEIRVLSQSPEAGTSVYQGHMIRLSTSDTRLPDDGSDQ